MKFEGYSQKPKRKMKTAKQMITPEQRLASDLREKFSRENFGNLEPISEQRDKELRQEIDDVASIFEKAERPWFVGGGTALELHTGKLQRDHGDHDVFIWKNDIEKFIQHIRDSGYEIFLVTPGKEDVEATEQQMLSETNFHLKRRDGKGAYIDLRVLQNENAEGLSVARNSIGDAGRFTTDNGKEVVLKNKEALIVNKIFGARQLDFLDLKIYLSILSQEERERLNGYLESVGATFVIGDNETQNLNELLQLAEAATEEMKETFLGTKIDEAILRNRERFDTTVEKIFEIASRTDAPENFLEEIKKEFGEDLVIRRKDEIDEVLKFIFGDKKPTQEEFREFTYRAFNFRQILEKELKTTALTTERWKVRTKDENVDRPTLTCGV